MEFLKNIVDGAFSNPKLFNFARNILEDNFVVPKKIITKELDKNKKTLDIGCGTGQFSTLFNPDHYHGIDISKKYITHAKDNLKGSFSVMDAQKIKFPDNTFDNILVVGLFHHLNDKIVDNILKEMKRVAKKKARILIMEDIPTKSAINLVGKVVHYFDGGSDIRKTANYKKLLVKHFSIIKGFETISGVCDYCIFIMEK